MSELLLLAVLRVAALAVLAVSAWSVWVRRLTFGSRFDMPATVSVALFGVGAALDSPSRVIAIFSQPLTGKYYLLGVTAHLCYIAGAAIGVSAAYRRLLPDDAIGPFVRRVVIPLAGSAAAVMVIAAVLSSSTSTLTADQLYLVNPDGWLTLYWVTHFGTTTLFGGIACYGVLHLRRDPRGVWLNLMLGSLALAALAGGLFGGWTVIAGRVGPAWMMAWLATYAAFAAAAIAAALQWRHRQQVLFRPSLA